MSDLGQPPPSYTDSARKTTDPMPDCWHLHMPQNGIMPPTSPKLCFDLSPRWRAALTALSEASICDQGRSGVFAIVHDIGHTYATLSLDSGVTPKATQI
jgi:hypothetical protein